MWKTRTIQTAADGSTTDSDSTISALPLVAASLPPSTLAQLSTASSEVSHLAPSASSPSTSDSAGPWASSIASALDWPGTRSVFSDSASTATSANASTAVSDTASPSQDTDKATTNNSQPKSLGSSEVIALAIGLGIGIPAVGVALLAWLFPRHRRRNRLRRTP